MGVTEGEKDLQRLTKEKEIERSFKSPIQYENGIRLFKKWEHQGRGDRINILSHDNLKEKGEIEFSGNVEDYPEKGDYIDVNMASGNTLRFRITEARILDSRTDQFFANGEAIRRIDKKKDGLSSGEISGEEKTFVQKYEEEQQSNEKSVKQI